MEFYVYSGKRETAQRLYSRTYIKAPIASWFDAENVEDLLRTIKKIGVKGPFIAVATVTQKIPIKEDGEIVAYEGIITKIDVYDCSLL